MKAHVHSVRIAPKKANLVAKMVRGMPVPDALESLRRTHKKAARIIESLLRSAVANAGHNDKQDAQTMVITSLVVNQGTGYRRGMPKARGQTRPYRKFLSHVSVTLGFPEEGKSGKSERSETSGSVKSQEVSSKAAKTDVKKGGSQKARKTANKQASASSDSSDSPK